MNNNDRLSLIMMEYKYISPKGMRRTCTTFQRDATKRCFGCLENSGCVRVSQGSRTSVTSMDYLLIIVC